MFAPDDHFLTTLRLLRTLPVYPLFGRGGTRLQPVHADDVAEAIARILGCAASTGHPYYELGGPSTYTYAELLRGFADRIGTRAWILPLTIRAVAGGSLRVRVRAWRPAHPQPSRADALLQRHTSDVHLGNSSSIHGAAG
jgi:uncharacterized protein YbjT (DUF2867 family)